MRPWSRPAFSTRPALISDCEALATIHASAFKRGWSDAEFEALLLQTGVHAILAHRNGAFRGRSAAGFILYRLAADEAEVLSVAVTPDSRRRGIGKALLEEAMRHLYRVGARNIHLEVEDSNAAAIGLYRGMEFRESGRRKGYYAEGRDAAAGALVMSRPLR